MLELPEVEEGGHQVTIFYMEEALSRSFPGDATLEVG